MTSRKGIKIVGIHEIASRMGFTRQRAHYLSHEDTFPLPLGELAQGRVWVESEVATWYRNRYGRW